MTQKEKLMRAVAMAQHVKSIANSIAFDAKSYDEHWPLHHAKDLEYVADEFLKLFRK